MPDLLLELFSEEIPARMQQGAARDLERLVVGALTDRGFLFDGIKAFAGPRRLTLAVSGLPAKQGDVREELKGPRIDAPAAALDGFLKKTGLTKDQLRIEKTPKGDVYMALIERAGRATPDVLAELLPQALPKLPWPKSMRWRPGDPVRWVRPLHSIIATFDGEVVPFEFAGVKSGNTTLGHRFLSRGPLTVRRFEDYAVALQKRHVVLDVEQRKAIIFEGVKSAAFVHGLEMIPDEGLLGEVAGLAEWPVILTGAIEDQFMDVPAEILQTAMRTHQKYFSLRDPKTGKLANRFALVANTIADDGGKEIVAGNERVLRARLFDAKFFWDEDRKHTLESRVDALKGIVFHAKGGTVYERAVRISYIAGFLADSLKLDVAEAMRAGLLAKADLVTGVVAEFPELQGIMGGYYAQHDGETENVSLAIRDNYLPEGSDDAMPETDLAAIVSVAEKLDSLATLWRAGERATGSRDPFGLRRAALGYIRIILEKNLRINYLTPIIFSLSMSRSSRRDEAEKKVRSLLSNQNLFEINESLFALIGQKINTDGIKHPHPQLADWIDQEDFIVVNELGKFILDRLKVVIRESGISHDLVDAVIREIDNDDIWLLVKRAEALHAFLKTEDGVNLLAGYKRAANILKAEEKKSGKTYTSEVSEKLLMAAAEKDLYAALAKAKSGIAPALAREDFAAAMQQMAALRGPVDAFFEAVKVNDENAELRENRLNLLAALRAALHQAADFSRIEG